MTDVHQKYRSKVAQQKSATKVYVRPASYSWHIIAQSEGRLQNNNRMWANAQRDGRPAEYR